MNKPARFTIAPDVSRMATGELLSLLERTMAEINLRDVWALSTDMDDTLSAAETAIDKLACDGREYLEWARTENAA